MSAPDVRSWKTRLAKGYSARSSAAASMWTAAGWRMGRCEDQAAPVGRAWKRKNTTKCLAKRVMPRT